MNETLTIYHNPRCSKSRRTLELLQENGVDARVVEYLRTPPSVEELQQLLAKLGRSAGELIRTGESTYAELGLDAATASDAELIAAMHRYPVLIERPIVVRGERAVVGRPPQAVLTLL